MSHSLKDTAARLGLKHRELMKKMRNHGLLDKFNRPANPTLTKLYLVTREYRYDHPKLGVQYPRTTRVTDAGIPWLADKLDIERVLPPAAPDPRDAA